MRKILKINAEENLQKKKMVNNDKCCGEKRVITKLDCVHCVRQPAGDY